MLHIVKHGCNAKLFSLIATNWASMVCIILSNRFYAV